MAKKQVPDDQGVQSFLIGKSELTVTLYYHFIQQFQRAGEITIHPAKTMIGLANSHRRVVWVTQFGKNFVHVVFPFKQPYPDNLCFQKIVQVPGDAKQFNHHFRMFRPEDVNEEVLRFMQLAYNDEH